MNHCPVVGLTKDGAGYVDGVVAEDLEGGDELRIRARCVVNACGPFADELRAVDDAGAAPLLAPSQGVHLVFDRRFLPGESAIMVPRTSDGRVLFAIPWHGHTLVGTTDTPIDRPTPEPRALDEEVDFVLETAQRYLSADPSREDVRSMFVGIRPLVRADAGKSTAALSRDHTIHVADSGLLTIVGGKWTTYRLMAQSAVDHAAMLGRLDDRRCVTRTLPVHGRPADADEQDPAERDDFADWGSDAETLRELIRGDPALGERICPRLPYRLAQVVHAVRAEMARSVEDVLARRTRVLFLDAAGAIAAAPRVAALLARELGREPSWAEAQVRDFGALAAQYRAPPERATRRTEPPGP